MISVFLCSPHASGVTDALGAALAESIGASVIPLRAYSYKPCLGCSQCLGNGGICVLPPDGADEIFELMDASQAIAFTAPVYFYALPAPFKALIDRSQKFWGMPQRAKSPKKAVVIMAAGRAAGEKLFSGSLLTLKWFLKPFGYEIASAETFRGLDTTKDLAARPDCLKKAASAGKYLAVQEQT